MGTVFSAHDESLERDVALKIIKARHLSDPAMRFRLAREAKIVARIQHPGVTALFDTGELEDGSAFLVMELLRGRDLATLLAEFGAGTPSQVARVLRQTSAALAAAHGAGIIHRDIKPENIFLVTGSGGFQAKLLDFGVALSAHTDGRLTQTGMVVGTPGYMSPEQVQGKDLDEKADLYSLASVAWEALAGRRLVEGKEMADLVLNVLYDPPTPLSQVLPAMPPEVDGLFDAALSKSRRARPSDVESWAASLASLLEGIEVPGAKGWPAKGWADPRLSAHRETKASTVGPMPSGETAELDTGKEHRARRRTRETDETGA